jgi:hypothetical protein
MNTSKRGVRGVKGGPKTGWRQGDFADFSIVIQVVVQIFANFFLVDVEFCTNVIFLHE